MNLIGSVKDIRVGDIVRLSSRSFGTGETFELEDNVGVVLRKFVNEKNHHYVEVFINEKSYIIKTAGEKNFDSAKYNFQRILL